MKIIGNKQKGITLIALVVTVLIILILTGVSIQTLVGENGIINNALEAKKQTEIATEREKIQLAIISSYVDTSNENYGEPLYDQNNINADIWNVVVSVSNKNEIYGTGWYYIAEGTDLDEYGQTNYDWVVNYDTGEMVYLKKGKYTKYSHEMNLAVTDYVFNMDSSNVGSDLSTWGDNVSLRYFDIDQYDTKEKRLEQYNEEINYTSVTDFEGYDRKVATDMTNYIDSSTNAFKFNGNNYIEIYNENGFDFSEGLTLEYYGKIRDKMVATSSSYFIGLLGLWKGRYDQQCITRLGYSLYYYGLQYSLTTSETGLTDYGSWSVSTTPWNQVYVLDDVIGNDKYITITFDASGQDDVIQSIYIDGIRVAEGTISKSYYDAFISKSSVLNYIELGRCTMTEESNWCYLVGECYTTRIYKRALSSDEVFANYDTTTTYRALINE